MAAIELRPEHHVGTVDSHDRGWSLVVERRPPHHVHVVAVDSTGAPRGFVRVHRAAVPALIETLLAASEGES